MGKQAGNLFGLISPVIYPAPPFLSSTFYLHRGGGFNRSITINRSITSTINSNSTVNITYINKAWQGVRYLE